MRPAPVGVVMMRALCLIVTIGGYQYAAACMDDPEGSAWHHVAPGMLPAVGECAECIPTDWPRADVRFRPIPCEAS